MDWLQDKGYPLEDIFGMIVSIALLASALYILLGSY
jgi:hypothetical protein